MKPLNRLEKFVDRMMPFMLALLTILIILDLTHMTDRYHDQLIYLDYLIIAFFIADLSFKWVRTKNMATFVKLYWIDIVAVFPFYTVFRAYALAAELVASGESAQKILHEAVLLRETRVLKELEYAKLARDAELLKLAREGRLIRVAARTLRLLRARWYVAHEKMKHASMAL